MRAFEGGLGEEDAIVGQDADLLAVDAGETRHERGTVVALELGEFAAVDDAGDDFVGGDGGAEVRAYYAGKLGGGVERFFPGGGGSGFGGPVEVTDGASG